LLYFTAAFVFTLAITGSSAHADTDLVKRGSYLVNGILTCGNCHSPKGPTGDIAEKAFSGGLNWDEPLFKVTAPNITPDKESGIGNYTDAELKEVLRKGIKRNAVPVAMVMPSGFYEVMTDGDLDAVIAYLHTIKPISNTVPDPVYKMPQGHPVPPGGDKKFTEAMLSDKLSKGWNATRRWGRVGANSILNSGPAALSFQDPGAFRSRGISPQARPRASALGPTMRSSAPSPKASVATARV